MQDLGLLQEYNLITDSGSFTCTEFGDAMARYYVQFDTMKIFMGLQPKAQISEIVSTRNYHYQHTPINLHV
jgi:ATP-dependent DNA helicase HFM1/MER3